MNNRIIHSEPIRLPYLAPAASHPIPVGVAAIENEQRELSKKARADAAILEAKRLSLVKIMDDFHAMMTRWTELSADIAAAQASCKNYQERDKAFRAEVLSYLAGRLGGEVGVLISQSSDHFASEAASLCEEFAAQRTKQRAELEIEIRSYTKTHLLENSLPAQFPKAAQ